MYLESHILISTSNSNQRFHNKILIPELSTYLSSIELGHDGNFVPVDVTAGGELVPGGAQPRREGVDRVMEVLMLVGFLLIAGHQLLQQITAHHKGPSQCCTS